MNPSIQNNVSNCSASAMQKMNSNNRLTDDEDRVYNMMQMPAA